jgi:vesicle transport through interaction with t-SNAREs protein 1
MDVNVVNRMYQQRVVTGAIVTLLVLLIGIVFWEKLS